MNDGVIENDLNDSGISKSWREKFALLEYIGAGRQSVFKAMKTPEFKALKYGQRQKISYNFGAFLFGPFYYFAKKMWDKGCVILGFAILWGLLLSLVEVAFGVNLPPVVSWIPTAAVCAQIANADVYRFVRYGEKMWPGLPVFSRPFVPAVFLLGSFALLTGTILVLERMGS